MKTLIFIISFLAFHGIAWATNPTGIQFFHGTWKEAQEKAAVENKIIFVDFYADWCGPCKWMSKEVFTAPEVGQAFAPGIIALKINAETEEQALVESLKLTAYPTLALFSSKGELLARLEGALDVQELISFVQAQTGFGEKEKRYHENPRDFAMFNAYLEALIYQDKEKAKTEVVNFLDQLSPRELQTTQAWDLLVKYVEDYNSKAVAFVFEHASWYRDNCGGYSDGLNWFTQSMLGGAAENQDFELVKKALNYHVAARKSLGTLTQTNTYYEQAFKITYLLASGDTLSYAQETLSFLKRYHAKDADIMAAGIQEVLLSGAKSPDVIAECVKLAEASHTNKPTAFTEWVLAQAYQKRDGFISATSFDLMQKALKKIKPDLIALDGNTMTINFPESINTTSRIPFSL